MLPGPAAADPKLRVVADPATGAVRSVQARAGALTEPAGGDRAAVALRWVREHRSALGLSADDVDGLRLTARTLSAGTGFTRVRFGQAVGGIPSFDGGLQVNLDRGGRILSVTGSPLPDLPETAPAPRLDAAAALRALQREVGVRRPVAIAEGPEGVRRTTRFEGGDLARLVRFGPKARPAWHLTYRATSSAHYDAVVDARSGAILFLQNLTRADGRALVYPSHPTTVAPSSIDLETAGWISLADTILDGPFARTYSDVNANDQPDAGEEIVRTAFGDFQYPFTAYTGATCNNPNARCSWAPPNDWATNRQQNGVQAFYLVNRFHDHLANDPQIGFTDGTDGFSGADAVIVETNDGDGLNNASMSTPADGSPPVMQLHRFTGEGFRNVNAGDSAAIVWHEYAHGLSSRLVTWGDGSAALSGAQAGAMGEGWSDWYALDLLVVDRPRDRHGDRRRRGRRRVHRRGAARAADAGDRLPGRRRHGGLPGRRPHVRRLRDDRRRPGRPRRRRDLGADAVGPAGRGRRRPRAGAHHPGHADVAARAVVPGHAQRDPGRRGRAAGRPPGDRVGGLPQARDGLLRPRRGRGRQLAGGGLQPPAGPRLAAGRDGRHRHVGRHGADDRRT